MTDVDEFRSRFLPRQAEAEAEFHGGDAGPRMELWSRRDPVTLFGARGMFRSGWDELEDTFVDVASESDVTDYRFEVLVADVVGDMAYAVGYERFNGIDQRPSRGARNGPLDSRLPPGGWRVEDRPLHRHGDNPPSEA